MAFRCSPCNGEQTQKNAVSTQSLAPSNQPTVPPQKPPPGLRRISGNVLEDSDNDGLGDDGIAKVLIQLWDDFGMLKSNTATDESGAFMFERVPPGSYTVWEITPGGYMDVSDSDGGNPNVISVDVTMGDSFQNIFVDELPSTSPSETP